MGNVTVNSKLFLGEEGIINGNITAVLIIIQGKVEGNIDCETKVVICNSAVIHGNIIAETIDIHEGSVINGSVIKRSGTTSDKKIIIREISKAASYKMTETKKDIIAVKEINKVEEQAKVSIDGWF